MTEKEKCATGSLYDANYDENLLKERDRCKDICFEYNNTKPSMLYTQKDLLRNLFGKTDGDFTIQAPFWCDYGYNIELGKNFYANHNLIILDGAKVKFGDNVFVAPDCGFHTAGHPIDAHRRNQGLEYAWPITVGNNVWIGAGVHVCPGVTIGNNVVIGAGSVVTSDIPDNVIAVGNPCRVLRKITEKEINKEYMRNIEIMDNKKIVTEFFNEGYTKKNYDYIMQYVSEEYVDHSPANARSNMDVVNVLKEVADQFSELRAEVVDVFSENNMVAVRVWFEGIHTGICMEIPETGKKMSFEALEYFKVENGKIVESWGYWPDKEIERQLLA